VGFRRPLPDASRPEMARVLTAPCRLGRLTSVVSDLPHAVATVDRNLCPLPQDAIPPMGAGR
jgi:hypothetical protein